MYLRRLARELHGSRAVKCHDEDAQLAGLPRAYPRRLACESQGSHAEKCHGEDVREIWIC